jgi:hypothetical protein
VLAVEQRLRPRTIVGVPEPRGARLRGDRAAWCSATVALGRAVLGYRGARPRGARSELRRPLRSACRVVRRDWCGQPRATRHRNFVARLPTPLTAPYPCARSPFKIYI